MIFEQIPHLKVLQITKSPTFSKSKFLIFFFRQFWNFPFFFAETNDESADDDDDEDDGDDDDEDEDMETDETKSPKKSPQKSPKKEVNGTPAVKEIATKKEKKKNKNKAETPVSSQTSNASSVKSEPKSPGMLFMKTFLKSYLNTVWTFQEFSVIQILREICFVGFRSYKTAVFASFGALNFVILVNISIWKVQQFIKIKFQSLSTMWITD